MIAEYASNSGKGNRDVSIDQSIKRWQVTVVCCVDTHILHLVKAA